MTWIAFSLFSALFASTAVIIEKKELLKQHAMEFSAAIAVANGLISAVFLFFIDISQISLPAIGVMYIVSVLAALAYLFVAKSIRHMEISSASPLLSIEPAIAAVLAFFVLNESMEILQIGGIFLLIIGAYILELQPNHNLIEPIKVFIRSKYIHLILIAIVFYAITSVLDRTMVSKLQISPISYIVIVQIFLALNYIILMSIFHGGILEIEKTIKERGFFIWAVAFFTIGYRILQLFAMQTAYVGHAIAIKRTSVFFTTLIGGELFKEKNLGRKITASLIMVIGAILVIL